MDLDECFNSWYQSFYYPENNKPKREFEMRPNEEFNINKYLGTWYELYHYPTWFLPKDSYNTTAEYNLMNDGNVSVKNSTMVNGKEVTSYGTAQVLSPFNLKVSFPSNEVKNLISQGNVNIKNFNVMEIFSGINNLSPNYPNYVINRIFYDRNGNYLYSIVTDPMKNSLYVLSRKKNPPLNEITEVMNYVINNFDESRIVKTPQF